MFYPIGTLDNLLKSRYL